MRRRRRIERSLLSVRMFGRGLKVTLIEGPAIGIAWFRVLSPGLLLCTRAWIFPK